MITKSHLNYIKTNHKINYKQKQKQKQKALDMIKETNTNFLK